MSENPKNLQINTTILKFGGFVQQNEQLYWLFKRDPDYMAYYRAQMARISSPIPLENQWKNAGFQAPNIWV